MTIIKDLINLFYPNLCVVCNKKLVNQEKFICTSCLYFLPKTNYHLQAENPVSALFWGRVNIQNATALFHFNKGSQYQDMMHKFKYHGLKEIGYILGNFLGSYLKESIFNQVDVIIPVPLHKSKYRKRGYNQSEWIAKGLSYQLKKPINISALTRKYASYTQTNKSRYERWENVKDLFKVKAEKDLKNKHILLVDDIITTGSTLEACANVILKLENTKVSVATLAVA